MTEPRSPVHSVRSDSGDTALDFGFLRHPESIDFDGGKVLLLEGCDSACRHVQKYRHRDGYLYPPLKRTVRIDIESGERREPVANTERPARVFPPPLSHTVYLSAHVVTGDVRRGDASVIVHLLALLFDTRLQFRGWRFDGKVPIPDKSSIFLLAGALEGALSRVYRTWCDWPESDRTSLVKILYMHGRAKSCEWEWYRFLTQYMVLDAIYKLAQNRGFIGKIASHQQRLVQLCDVFDVPKHQATINQIVKVRNELVHEASIDGKLPGTRVDSTLHLSKWLERLNARLIFAVAGYKNEFVRSGWWFFGWQRFGKNEG